MSIQLEGVPDGYEVVRWGKVNYGDVFMEGTDARMWNVYGESRNEYLVVKPIEPPKPKTKTVVINEYLVWTSSRPEERRIVLCDEAYADSFHVQYKLIGHYKTIEVEV